MPKPMLPGWAAQPTLFGPPSRPFTTRRLSVTMRTTGMKAPSLPLNLLAATALLLGGCGDKTPPPSGGMEGGKAGETRVFGGIEMVWCPPGSFMMGSPEDLKFGVMDWNLYMGGEAGR